MRNLILLFALIFISLPAGAAENLPGPYRTEILEVIDGDTVRARIHIWLGQDIETLVRLDGIDTPEMKGRCTQEREKATQARNTLKNILAAQPVVYLHDISTGKYAGRIVARIAQADGQDISTLLLSRNLARPYNGRARASWC